MMVWLHLSIAIVAEVIATSALKATESFTKPLPLAAVVVGYLVSFYFLSLTLTVLPVGIAYAVWSGAGIILVSMIGWLVFNQSLDWAAVAGIAMILAGVAVINLFSKASAH
ncbi:MAG: DMT family transporter [Planctomycetota bacterium]|nr:multidrug efflux SMR transporter [Planctomycetota bacterium]